MDVRSYRAVFDLERRVYRIDTVRLNPAGIPLRGILYAGVLVVATFVADRLPPVHLALAPLPWYVRYLGMPIAAGALATVARIEGRPFHLAVRAILAQRLAATHTRGLVRVPAPNARWRSGPVVLIPDGSDGRLRRFRYRGPGAVLVCCAHDRVEWSRRAFAATSRGVDLTLHAQRDGRPLQRPAALELPAGVVIETRTSPAP